MRNRYPGYCYKCGKYVEKGQGHAERYKGRWRVQHWHHAKRIIEQDQTKKSKLDINLEV